MGKSKQSATSHLSANHKEENFEIPAEGMLGLLALGATGLTAWRTRRAEIEGRDWRDKIARRLDNIEHEAETIDSDHKTERLLTRERDR